MKPIWKSKTFWFHALVLLLTLLDALITHKVVTDPQRVAWIMVGISLLGVLLRIVTDQPVSLPWDKSSGEPRRWKSNTYR